MIDYSNIAQELWKKQWFQRTLDCIRIATFIILLFIIVYLVINIEAVKALSYDSCKICSEKVGWICNYIEGVG